jgi:hypothetical protein
MNIRVHLRGIRCKHKVVIILIKLEGDVLIGSLNESETNAMSLTILEVNIIHPNVHSSK